MIKELTERTSKGQSSIFLMRESGSIFWTLIRLIRISAPWNWPNQLFSLMDVRINNFQFISEVVFLFISQYRNAFLDQWTWLAKNGVKN